MIASFFSLLINWSCRLSFRRKLLKQVVVLTSTGNDVIRSQFLNCHNIVGVYANIPFTVARRIRSYEKCLMSDFRSCDEIYVSSK